MKRSMGIGLSALFVTLAVAACATSEFPEGSMNLDESLRLAQITRNSGGIASAVTQLRQLSADHPGSSEVFLALGDALFDSRSYGEAEDAYVKAGQLDSSIETPEVGLGRVCLARQIPTKALEHFATALRLKANSIAALNGSGVANDMLGNTVAAQKFYRQALAVQPHDQMARSNLALSLALDGRTREAIVILSELVQQAGIPVSIRQNLVLAYALAGNRKSAAEIAAMDLNPKQVEENLAFYAMVRDSHAAAHANSLPRPGLAPAIGPAPAAPGGSPAGTFR